MINFVLYGENLSKNETIKLLGLNPDDQYIHYLRCFVGCCQCAKRDSFLNPVEWVIETIKWFNNNQDNN